jgi:hypothetical protein
LQLLAHGAVGVGGLRLDARADDIANQGIYRRRDPGVVPRVPPCSARRRGGTGQDRRVQAVEGFGAFPSVPTARRVKRARPAKPEKLSKKIPHAADSHPARNP